jgi:hypothetical protein
MLDAPEGVGARGQLHPLAHLPEACAIFWGGTESDPRASLFQAQPADAAGMRRILRQDLGGAQPRELAETSDRVVALLADQWAAKGRVFALLGGAAGFQVLAWDPAEPDGPAMPRAGYRFDDIGAAPPADPIHVVALPEGLALLFRSESSWIAMTPTARWELPFTHAPAPSTPRLVADGRAQVSVVFPHDERGFVTIAI